MKKNDLNAFANQIETFVPGVAMDCVVLGYQDNSLHVLLLKYRNTDAWALPGGFLPKDCEMDDQVSIILKERTQVEGIFLTQFHTFSSINRNWKHNELSHKAVDHFISIWPKETLALFERWAKQRFISTAYVALVDAKKVTPVPDFLSESCQWVPVDILPNLISDHELIIARALKFLRTQLNYLPVGRELLDEKFTMTDLQSLYEVILDKKLDRGNFYRKIMKLNILIRHEKLMTGAQNKAPYLYSFNDEIYNHLIEEGIGFS